MYERSITPSRRRITPLLKPGDPRPTVHETARGCCWWVCNSALNSVGDVPDEELPEFIAELQRLLANAQKDLQDFARRTRRAAITNKTEKEYNNA